MAEKSVATVENFPQQLHSAMDRLARRLSFSVRGGRLLQKGNDYMKYQIKSIDETDGWIFISADNSFYEPDSFIEMLKMISSSVDGKIVCVGDCQYSVTNIPYDIVFQWDDLFGIVIINRDKSEKDAVIQFVNDLGIV